MGRKSRYTRQKRRSFWPGFLGACLIAGGAYWLITNVWLNQIHEDPDWVGRSQPIFVDGQLMDGDALGTGDQLKLPVKVLQEAVDAGIRYEPESGDIIIASPQRVLHMKEDSTQAELNHKDYPMTVKPEVKDGEAYIPLKPLKEVYGIAIQEDSVTGEETRYNMQRLICCHPKQIRRCRYINVGENPHQSLPIWKRMQGYVYGTQVMNRVLSNSIMDMPDM